MISKTKIITLILCFSTAVTYYALLLETYWGSGRPPLPHAQSDSFLIDTPGCQIPYIDHFHPSVKILYKKTDAESIDCGGLDLLIVKDNTVLLDKNKFVKLFGNVSLNCTYRKIVRNPVNDEKASADWRYGFRGNKTLKFGEPINDEYINVKCFSGGKMIFEDFIALLLLKSDVEKKCADRSKILSPQRLNIIMLAIDSVSKLNFLRHFNRTYDYLHNTLQAFEFHGHTKVADNTFVNIMPLLTGHFYNFYRTDSKELSAKYLDDVDLIWKEYSSIGYRTFYVEDSPTIGTFTYMKRGFRYPPTDYYLRPFTMAVEKATKVYRYGCFGARPEARFMNDHLLKFAHMMDQRPFFALVFHSRFTHSFANDAGYMDRPTVDVLQQLHESGTLNKSLLFFFSDHGIRFGKIRRTYVGKIEERMPFMFLHLPRWFLETHPNISRNLKINQRRLTTPFDMYQTLAHTVSIVSPKKVVQNGTLGISLFAGIPPERTCSDAGISPHWCTCNKHVKIPVHDRNVQRAAEFMIETINHWFKATSNFSPCAELSVDKVVDARISVPYKFLLGVTGIPSGIDERAEHFTNKIGLYLDYLITVTASPSNAVLEATLRHDQSVFKLLDVSRINAFGNQSYCIRDYELRKFCFCKSLLSDATPQILEN